MKIRKKIQQFITVFVLAMITGGLMTWDLESKNKKTAKSKPGTEIQNSN